MLFDSIYHLTFIIIYTIETSAKDLLVTSAGVKEISTKSVGIPFYTTLNNTSDEDYFVELRSDKCCIDSDCGSLEIIGECSGIVPEGKTKAFTLVLPVLDPLRRQGFCVIYLDSRPVDKRNQIIRDVININFDTGLSINDDNIEELVKKCRAVDQDPSNNCKPVDCDLYYNGRKPVFDRTLQRCVEAPSCGRSKVYDPVSNLCINRKTVDAFDIDYIKKMLVKRNNERKSKDVIIVENSPDYEYRLTSLLNTNAINGTKTKEFKEKGKFLCMNILEFLVSNKYTICLLSIIICIQCCLIFTMIYCLMRKFMHKNEKKVERKYFNYRQDASVTTPLIATSNIDTETTAFDYVSESLDDKIKCYKACQKDMENGNKLSFSDDILSKCINRRDWNTLPKSETNQIEINQDSAKWREIIDEYNKLKVDTIPNEVGDKIPQPDHVEDKRKDGDVNVSKMDDKCDCDVNSPSEKMIKCHDYNVTKLQNCSHFRSEGNVASIAADNATQASFPSDSLDRLIECNNNERMQYLGDDLSKYSFQTSTHSENESSKTSKDNFIKRVCSLLSRKSRISSDPGLRKQKSLRLIHMSRATVCSSVSENKKAVAQKDSRSSMF